MISQRNRGHTQEEEEEEEEEEERLHYAKESMDIHGRRKRFNMNQSTTSHHLTLKGNYFLANLSVCKRRRERRRPKKTHYVGGAALRFVPRPAVLLHAPPASAPASAPPMFLCSSSSASFRFSL